MKLVMNKCYGGFGLSHEAVMRYASIKGIRLYPFIDNVSKQVYKEKATLDNPNIFRHYSTKPVANEDKMDDDCYWSVSNIPRDDPALIQVVEELGSKASSSYSKLEIVKIPDGVKWQIEEYDGIEWVSEEHRTWR